MKKLFVTTFLAGACATALFAQTKEEKEVLKVNEAYEAAMAKGDYDAQEKVLSPNYVTYLPDGSFEGRAQVAEYFKKQKTSPTYKMISMVSDDVKAKVSGNLAVVTGAWKATTKTTDAEAQPHQDAGRYTAIFEKQNGTWLLLSDHVTEKPHTPEEMEPDLRKASDTYDRAMLARDAAMFEKLLADDFMYTSNKGKTSNKQEEINNMTTADLAISSAKASDKKFRIYRNAAVETGRYDVTGTYKGTPFTESGRYTTTWIYKDGKWRIVADHTSVLPAPTSTTAAN
jgi:uncharacterized protein (TIGR02246 family)